MNADLLENIKALLDFHKIPRNIQPRVDYLSQNCACDAGEVEKFLLGESNLSKGIIKNIADFFEVDLFWLLGKTQ
ncbi:MAG: hypothetical protein U1E78_11315 [Gammaproteobacteria bacterium]